MVRTQLQPGQPGGGNAFYASTLASQMAYGGVPLTFGESGQAEQRRRTDPDYLGGNVQPATGQGVPDYNNTRTQSTHVGASFDTAKLAARTGVSMEKAEEFKDALDGATGGFTWGWDRAIRAYQRGATKEDIKALPKTMDAIADNFGGDENAYFAALSSKASLCEELIDRSPKWNGSELQRGFNNLDERTMQRLTSTEPGTIINLNAGTASWTTDQYTAEGFAGHGSGSLVAHVTGERRGTSIRAGSHFFGEEEVLCSRREAFRCVRVEKHGSTTHAYYEVVDTDYDWS